MNEWGQTPPASGHGHGHELSMSPSPERRRVLDERSPSERNKLQIRLVPYHPPRLSSDDPSLAPSCPPERDRPGSHRREQRQPPEPQTLRPSLSPSPLHPRHPPLAPPTAPKKAPLLRRRPNFISLHSDKTFSLLPHFSSASSATDSSGSRRRSSTVPSSSSRPSLTPLSEQSQPGPTPAKASIRPLPRLPEALPTRPLGEKHSFHSSHSASTLSERYNYKTYAHGSPSTVIDYCSDDDQTGESEDNYLAHSGQSPSSVLARPGPQLRSEYSRESLLVSPLRPARESFSEQLGLSKPRSRDSLRSGSLTSMSSVVIEGAARSLFAAASLRQKPSRRPSISVSSGAHQHTWNSTLSTVFSEGEGGSQGQSRSLSLLSSRGARAFTGFDGLATAVGGYPECPPAVRIRVSNREQNYGAIRLVRDQDEYGDGLADLEGLHHAPSRSRLYSSLSNYSSDRDLPSSGSSRSNSFSLSSVPAWARLYYGSGERRFLAAKPSMDSFLSECNDQNSRGSSPFLSRSPSAERFSAAIYSPRRRPRETVPRGPGRCGQTDLGTDSNVAAPSPALPVARGLRQQTSSIWSPHLGRDKRANRYSIWEPPSAVWSADGALPRYRNLQPVLFMIGFVFPLAWMIASLLPLPPWPRHEITRDLDSTSHLHLWLEANQRTEDVAEARRHNRARWWRSLNRVMSIVGMLVIGAVVALIVTGVQQRQRP